MIAGLGRLFFWSFGGTTEETVPLLLKLHGEASHLKSTCCFYSNDSKSMMPQVAEMPTKNLERNLHEKTPMAAGL